MNDKITITRLAAMLAISTGKQKKLCEDFLRELFSIVEEELLKGENVRIKGFGTFKLVVVESRKSVNVSNGEETIIPEHRKVLFVAAKELASRVNLPFEAFEAVEIADDLPTDSLEGEEEPEDLKLDSVVDDEPATDPQIETETKGEPEYISNDEAESVFEDPAPKAIESELKEGSDEELAEDEASVEAYSETPQDNNEYYEEEIPEEKSHKFAKGFVAGFVTALTGGAIVFAVGYLSGFTFGVSKGELMAENEHQATITEAVAKDSVSVSTSIINDTVSSTDDKIVKSADNGDDVPTKVSDGPVYDTVSTTRYLTTIAKEHYGNFNLWPIIYEENKDILGHPDRIRPGTKVVVPPLSKYGIDPKNAEQIKEIKKKGVEIYARFK